MLDNGPVCADGLHKISSALLFYCVVGGWLGNLVVPWGWRDDKGLVGLVNNNNTNITNNNT